VRLPGAVVEADAEQRMGVDHRGRRSVLFEAYLDVLRVAGEKRRHKRCCGLRSFAFNLLANPTETRDEMRDTLRLNSKLMPDGLKVSLGYPFPGTEYHDISKKLDLIDEGKHLHNSNRHRRAGLSCW